MMGPRQVAQGALFYEFSIEGFVPLDHPVRGIDRFLDLSDVRPLLAPFYRSGGRPSIDPELMIRMLLLGYCMGIQSERRLCDEVHVNLAYRWFCRLDLTDAVPDHSTFSKNRHALPGRRLRSNLPRGACNDASIKVWSAVTASAGRNGCFGDAAVPHRRSLRTTGLGRKRWRTWP